MLIDISKLIYSIAVILIALITIILISVVLYNMAIIYGGYFWAIVGLLLVYKGID